MLNRDETGYDSTTEQTLVDPNYWMCECTTQFIHSRHGYEDVCERCGALEEDYPDARLADFQEVHCRACEHVYAEAHDDPVKRCPNCHNDDPEQTVYLQR